MVGFVLISVFVSTLATVGPRVFRLLGRISLVAVKRVLIVFFAVTLLERLATFRGEAVQYAGCETAPEGLAEAGSVGFLSASDARETLKAGEWRTVEKGGDNAGGRSPGEGVRGG